MARSIRSLTELAEDVVRAADAIVRIKAGKNGGAVAELGTALERQLRKVVASRMKARKRAGKATRDSRGRFLM